MGRGVPFARGPWGRKGCLEMGVSTVRAARGTAWRGACRGAGNLPWKATLCSAWTSPANWPPWPSVHICPEGVLTPSRQEIR